MKRIENQDVAVKKPFGLVPKPDTIPLDGLSKQPDMEELLKFKKPFWQKEVKEMKHYFEEQCPEDTPQEIWDQIKQLESRIESATDEQ